MSIGHGENQRTLNRGSLTVSLLSALLILTLSTAGLGQDFEEAVVDVGNLGMTITNAGFFGKNSVRNNPTGPPSMEFPLDSGVEHLFEAGIWVGAVRSDGVITVRTGAVTTSTGYAPGVRHQRRYPGYFDSDARSTGKAGHVDHTADARLEFPVYGSLRHY
jgi:hypothetical protein